MTSYYYFALRAAWLPREYYDAIYNYFSHIRFQLIAFIFSLPVSVGFTISLLPKTLFIFIAEVNARLYHFHTSQYRRLATALCITDMFRQYMRPSHHNSTFTTLTARPSPCDAHISLRHYISRIEVSRQMHRGWLRKSDAGHYFRGATGYCLARIASQILSYCIAEHRSIDISISLVGPEKPTSPVSASTVTASSESGRATQS